MVRDGWAEIGTSGGGGGGGGDFVGRYVILGRERFLG